MNRCKVLHVIGGGEIGGAEELVLTLLKMLNPDKYEAQLLCLCEGPFADIAAGQGFTSITIPMKQQLDISTLQPVREYIRDEQISIVHTHGVRANLIARLAAKKEGKPVVTTVHSVLRYDYASKAKAALARYITMLTNNKTDSFIAISSAIEKDIKDMGVPAEKIHLIHNGLDTAKFKQPVNAAKIREKLGIIPGRTVIGMVARLHPVKGHEYFLQGARSLLDKGLDLQFLIIGEGTYRQKLEKMINDLDLKEHVMMPGYYSPMEDIYGVIDLLCLPSLMEGLGLVILEAMYFNIPVVASSVGGIPEIITNEVNGLLVAPRDYKGLADAVIKLLSDEQLRTDIQQQGAETVKEFSLENMAQKVEMIYDRLRIEYE